MDSDTLVREQIKQFGKGEGNNRQSFHISDDIDLAELKKKSKAYGVTINDLFVGSCISAFSKIDRPEELKPTGITAMIAYGFLTKETLAS